jgi:F0F1-type ATP synthase assembly protein I
MTLSNGGNSSGAPEELPKGTESAGSNDGENSELQERLAAIDIPPPSTLPYPPDIQFSRPRLGRAGAGRPKSGQSVDSESSSGSNAPGDEPYQQSHIGASLVIGVTFPTCVIVGASIGIWIDHRWNPHGTPWGTIVMSLAGIAAGFINIFRVVSMLDRSKSKKK